MGWILRATVPAADTEALTSLLWDLSTDGVAELPRTGPASAQGPGPVVELLAGFASPGRAAAAADALADHRRRDRPGAEPLVVVLEQVDDRAWVDPDRRSVVDVAGRRLVLEVGAAFGDGGHPSTALALALLTWAIGDAPAIGVAAPGTGVLDVGTGTGILALAARALGAATVTAVDNDPEALAVAARNLAAHPDLATGITLTAALPATGRYRVVVANLVLGTQRALARPIGRCLAPGGSLVLAGILAGQVHDVAAHHPGLDLAATNLDGDWAGVVLRRRDRPAAGAAG